MVFDTLVCSTVLMVLNTWSEPHLTSLEILLVLKVISPCLTMPIKQNSYNQHFVNSYIECMDVLKCVFLFLFLFLFYFQYGYIIHGKHDSTDKELYFIHHQNPPFLFLDPPFTKPPFIPIKSSIPPFYQFSEFLKPTVSKVWVTNYGQFRLSLLLLLRQNCTRNLR